MSSTHKQKAGNENRDRPVGKILNIFSRPFSDFFYVAASRPAKSPRKFDFSDSPCCGGRQWWQKRPPAHQWLLPRIPTSAL
jgi:hypothetical protein